ncbi:DUF4297 domain-containing protein [Otariodibacter oris]|uniref:Uncharacterized protein DUF4297 n=1 Tax=Otariodibacter oris TaxID=1032623 RepID=A0A420XK18_9PAST|nr:DUF4297 domain-containing protein [Otariodibacter oris]QGM80379.1 hypothetical protein A6A10_02680 [Otariodibacter oris]RKR77481.1 uncharacterized protein DUF4297 [Otariodibacter oris]
MSDSEYYMNLPLDLAGSRTKNRFRVELLWGIGKLIDSYKNYEDYTVVFDFKCDIELHYKRGFDFYQIKTKNRGNHSIKSLTNRKGNSNSILGTLYALYSPTQKVKLAVVCNKHLKISRNEDLRSEICLGELDKKIIDLVQDKLKEELALSNIILDNIFYICEELDLTHPDYAIKGKLIESFQNIKNEEPHNPNALYRLVFETAQKKASYELEITNYSDVLYWKGISKGEFDKMLEAHRKKSITGIEQTRDYIRKLSLKERREYNQALNNLLENYHSHNLNELQLLIFKYIKEKEDNIENEIILLEMLSSVFDKKFPVEYTEIMKKVFYLLIFYIYAEGGSI